MKSLKILAVVTAALLSVGAYAQEALTAAGNEFNAAMELAQGKKFADAAAKLEKTLTTALDLGEEAEALVADIQKQLPRVHMYSGVTLLQNKAFDEAIAELLKAEEMADLWGDVNTKRQASRYASTAYQFKGADFFNSKQFDKALAIFEQGYKQDPQNQQLALFTAQSYAEMNLLAKAVPIFDQVMQAGAANSKFAKEAEQAQQSLVQYALVAASAAGQASDFEGVTKYTDMVLDIIPTNPEANLMIVQLANNLKKYDIVIAKGEKAAAAQADLAKKSDVYLLLGVAYQNKENKAKALEYLGKVTAGSGVAQAKALVVELSK